MVATLVARGGDIGYTILPYDLDAPIQQELLANHSDRVLGYVTYNESTGERKFFSMESGHSTQASDHWSLAILKEFPYVEENGPWIVYSASPDETKLAYGKILGQYAQTLHINNWDIWTVPSKDQTVAVVTSWERY